MTTLFVNETRGAQQSVRAHASLQVWLDGQWGLVLSNPADFAPPPSTPIGYIAHEAAALREHGIKLITFNEADNTLQGGDTDPTTVDLHTTTDQGVVDFTERTLAMKIAALPRPWVLVIDPRGRCRSSFNYRPLRTDRPRTLHDLLHMIEVLRNSDTALIPSGRVAATATATAINRPSVRQLSSA